MANQSAPANPKSYWSRACKRVLVATIIGVLPVAVLLVFGIIDYQKPPDYGRDPDPELNVLIPLYLILASAVVTFAASWLVAVVYYFVAGRRM